MIEPLHIAGLILVNFGGGIIVANYPTETDGPDMKYGVLVVVGGLLFFAATLIP